MNSRIDGQFVINHEHMQRST